MRYLIKIMLQFLIITFLISCNESPDKDKNPVKDKNETKEIIISDSTKLLIKDIEPEIEKESTIIIPDEIDNFSATVVYYEDYIGKAYSKEEYKKHFEVNRKHLDSLIDEFDKRN